MRHQYIHYATGAVILLLLAANILQWRQSTACRKEIRVKEQLIAGIDVNTQSVSFLESNWQWNLTAERSDLAQLHVADTLGNYLPLGKIVREPVLVFRFRETDCQECVSFGLRKLGTFTGNAPLLLAQYYDNYPFKKWVRMNRIRFTSLNAPEALPPDKMGMPYFFVLHPDLTMGELFIPDKSHPELTTRYLKTIARKYFK